MEHRPLIALIITATGIFILLVFYLTRRFCYRSKQQQPQQQQVQRASSLQTGISKLHQQQENIYSNKRRTNYYVIRRGVSSKSLFKWSDNPLLVTDAVENGWSRFAFADFNSLPNKSVLGYCDPQKGDRRDTETVEIAWEVCEGSVDLMQKIRFNPGLKKTVSSMAAVSVFKTALPLPGPAVPGPGNSSAFPQEAYFEITILSLYEDEIDTETDVNKKYGEKIKLIDMRNSNSTGNNSVGGSIGGVFAKVEELKGGKEIVDGKMEMRVDLSVGLAGGGLLPLKLPGSYPGSIGFNSDGSVYLEGVKLTTGLESDEWGKAEKVIGCGYNPSQKKVYFTIDAKLVREVYCTTEEFGTPLYPILAANSNVTVLVNFGQSVFKYTQANLHRTPNPCFIGQSTSSPVITFEDSRELFSMGRIDAHWLDRSTKRNAQYFGSVNRGISDYDESSEGDLFEIVLDSNSRGRSPSMHL